MGASKPRNLKARERALELRHRGLSYEEIARAMGINSGTVWRYINGRASRAQAEKSRDCELCGGRMTLTRERSWVCGDCGQAITRYGRLTEEQKARGRAATQKWRLKRQAEFRELIRQAKDRPCEDCGRKFPYYVMHFHHVRGQKKFGIAQAMARVGMTTCEELLEEIAKCDVVCANCHAMRHRGEYRDVA